MPSWTTTILVLLSFAGIAVAVSAAVVAFRGRAGGSGNQPQRPPLEGAGFYKAVPDEDRAQRLMVYGDFLSAARLARQDLLALGFLAAKGAALDPVQMVRDVLRSTERLGRSFSVVELVAPAEVVDFAEALYRSVAACERRIREQLADFKVPPHVLTDEERYEYGWEAALIEYWPKISASVAGEYEKQEVEILYEEVRDRMRRDLAYGGTGRVSFEAPGANWLR